MNNSKNNQRLTGVMLYVIAITFAALTIFLQVVPIETASYFQSKFVISSSKFVYLSSLFFIPYSFMQLPGGMLFDKYGLKYILPVCIGVTLIGTSIYWYATNAWLIGGGRIISGLGCSVAYISGIYAATKYFPSRRLPLLIGILEAFSTLGSIVAAKPLHWLIKTCGWNMAGVIIIGFCIGLSGLALIFTRHLTNEDPKASRQESFIGLMKQTISLLKNRNLLLIFFYSFCTWLIIMSFAGYWLKDYMIAVHHYNEQTALKLVEIYWTSFLITSLIVGYYIHDHHIAIKAILCLSLIGFVAYLSMAVPIIFSYITIIFIAVAGGVSGTGVIIAFALLPRFTPPAMNGTAVALNNTFVVLGGYFGQVLFGLILGKFNLDHYLQGIISKHGIEPHFYSAMLIYVVFATCSLVSAFLILTRNTSSLQVDQHIVVQL